MKGGGMLRRYTTEDYRRVTHARGYSRYGRDTFTTVCAVCWRSVHCYGGTLVGSIGSAFVCLRCKDRVVR